MPKSKEEKYIAYRKRKAFREGLLYYFFRLFPIQKNKIAVCTFEGKGGFCCNPRYIVEELHRRNGAYKFVWLVNDISKQFPEYIRPVKNTLWNRAFHLTTSKVWIDNYRKPYGTKKRRGQFYINTWHGTIGFKCTGLWRENAFSKMAYIVSKNDSDMVDYMISDSEWVNEHAPKGLIYSGEYLMSGAPRCDILYGDKTIFRNSLRKKLGISSNSKIVLFAPTFREKNDNGKRSVYSFKGNLDFKPLLESLEEKFGENWYICLRLHPQLADSANFKNDELAKEKIFDCSKADDMYEILAGIDALITDYSCVAMEAGFTEIPVFIYAEDLYEYMNSRGNSLWNFPENPNEKVLNNKNITPNINVELPFSVSKTNEELIFNIKNFDKTKYHESIEAFKKGVQLIFDGNASKKVADKIEEFISLGSK